MTGKDILADALLLKTDECFLWPLSVNARGYPQMRFAGRTREVHRIVCMLAHGDPPARHDAAHRCGIPRCINPRHLRWTTRKANIAEGMNHTNDQNGERNKQARLTAAQVLDIRADPRSGRLIGLDYGIHQVHVSMIKRRKAWAHI
jgi:HNH endonuclease